VNLFDRYYAIFISCLQLAKYTFPPPARYLEQFGRPLGTTFVATDRLGCQITPPLNTRWLVFHINADRSVVRYIARYYVQSGKRAILFGDHPQGLLIRLGPEEVVTGIEVLLENVNQLVTDGTFVV
jgi:hypothetical protein